MKILKFPRLLSILLLSPLFLFGQSKSILPIKYPNKPKLVLGIVIDQMRFDYLNRYYSKFGNGGFKRILKEGFNEKNMLYPYVPTATGPGHSSIFSGSVPAISGIIENEWYSRKDKKIIYCVSDTTVQSIGTGNKSGQMSPRNLLVSTITDQLKLSNNFKSKVIGISQKDRASILPAGHLANGAYWLDSETGNFISSNYYMKELPSWVQSFNQKKLAESYLSKDWNTLLPIDTYLESDPDNEPWESLLPGESNPVFPHILSKIPRKDFELIRSTPFGNDLTKDFALSALENEKLGKSEYTDFLTLSFSSTDYVGHAYGPNSIEIEDTYLRLDKDLEEILNYLDRNLGKENVLVFLTADHGVAAAPGFNLAHNIPAGLISGSNFVKGIQDYFQKNFGNAGLLEKFSNEQVYLNYSLVESLKLNEETLFNGLRTYLMEKEGVANLVDLNHIGNSNMIGDQLERIKNGFYAKRSGDFQLILEPNWMFGRSQGTNHGTSYHYDIHVPMLWYGWKIKAGSSIEKVKITDISSTLAFILGIEEPNGSIGKPESLILNP